MKSKQCAPSVSGTNEYSCFTKNELEQIALAFNIYIQTNKVCGKRKSKVCVPKKLIDIRSKSSKELWESIHKRLSIICKDEACWTNQSFINSIPDLNLRDKIRYFTFKPKMSRHSEQWLSTTDINRVMSQYQELDKTFKFVGALPSDFYNHTKVNYSDILKKYYKKMGFVFNLDKHNQPGSHWVAFLIDNVNQTLEYFDSTGKPPNTPISKFITNIVQILKENNLKYRLLVNRNEHQKQNSECGVYAMYFIIQRLLGNNFKTISDNVIHDQKMKQFRKYLFRR
jgi:hypothetical protein